MDSNNEKTITVRLLDTPFRVDRDYTYIAPVTVARGSLAVVPFGNGNRPVCAVVTGDAGICGDETAKLKRIERLLDYPIKLTDELLEMCGFLADRCLCTYGSVVKTLIPPGFNTKTDEFFAAVPTSELDALASCPAKSEELYRAMLGKGAMTLSEVPSDDARELLRPLIRTGLVRRTYELKKRVNEKNERYVRLAVSPETAEMYLNGELKLPSGQAGRVIELLLQNPEITQSELTEYASCGDGVVRTLVRYGIVTVETRRSERTPYRSFPHIPLPVLSTEQESAFAKVSELMDSGKPECALLFGVTGSGKTKVIIAAVQKALDEGKQAIVLVPEIGLASQAVELFMSHFGSRVTIIHSALSAGERIDAYRRVASGDADVVIGTRSAIFAPCERLGLIAVDEEQEHTYKSDMSPKYSAVDVAKFRSMKHNSLLLLASATPSVESFYRAQKGMYTLIRLNERYGNAVLPEVHFADLRDDETLKPEHMIGERLRAEIAENLKNGEQTILFLNRRGYNSTVTCRKCGQTVYCPNCSVPMALHVVGKSRILTCHYCGSTRPLDRVCPSCKSTAMGFTGYGTQRLEEELTELFPQARKIRMDGDTTVVRGSHDEIYRKFKNREADILYGTQMITKGLDFPCVTLVGIILADSFLYQTDFRACERTFSMLTQVIGRAGRADKAGRAIVQTYSPEHRTLVLAGKQDYDGFYGEDVRLRHAVQFPPFCDVAVFRVSGMDEQEVIKSASGFASALNEIRLEECPDAACIAFGPFEDPLYRLNGSFRRRLVIKFNNTRQMRSVFRKAMLAHMKESKDTYISADINPPVI